MSDSLLPPAFRFPRRHPQLPQAHPLCPRLRGEVAHTTDLGSRFGAFSSLYALMQFIFSPMPLGCRGPSCSAARAVRFFRQNLGGHRVQRGLAPDSPLSADGRQWPTSSVAGERDCASFNARPWLLFLLCCLPAAGAGGATCPPLHRAWHGGSCCRVRLNFCPRLPPQIFCSRSTPRAISNCSR